VLAAPADGDIESGFDLAQMLIERSAEIGQALVVERRQRDIEWLGLHDS
jgi:hypothetical protein